MVKDTTYTFKGIDWAKIGRGALVAVAGALLTYGTTFVTGTDFGVYTPVIVAVWSVIVNVGRKYVEA